MPKLDTDTNELIFVLEAKMDSPNQYDVQECLATVRALEFIGKNVDVAVPILRKALTHTRSWMRVCAARCLWRAEPSLWKIEQNAEEILSTLLAELQCEPVGLIAADCLGEMGTQAQVAIPALEQIINSQKRLVESGTDNDWIDEDEAFCAAAQSALERIQADINSQL